MMQFAELKPRTGLHFPNKRQNTFFNRTILPTHSGSDRAVALVALRRHTPHTARPIGGSDRATSSNVGVGGAE